MSLNAYVLAKIVRNVIDERDFASLETNPVFSMKELEELNGWTDDLINYVRDYVNLNVFAGVA